MRLKKAYILTIVVILAVAALIWTKRPRNHLSDIDAESIAEMHIRFIGPPPDGFEGERPKQQVIGTIPPDHYDDILSYLRPAGFAPHPAKWMEMAQIKIGFKGQSTRCGFRSVPRGDCVSILKLGVLPC